MIFGTRKTNYGMITATIHRLKKLFLFIISFQETDLFTIGNNLRFIFTSNLRSILLSYIK